MYNKAIVEAPATLFLGAGASKPFGKLLMVEFINQLEQGSRFKGSTLFDQIVKKRRDLEFLFEELDDWIGKDYYAPTEGYRKSDSYGLLGAAGLDREAVAFERAFHELLQEAHRLRADLKREVFNSYRVIPNPDVVVKLFQPIFDAACDQPNRHGQPLVIFTTNYDPSIETFRQQLAAKYALHDGFFHDEGSMTYVWKRSQFDQFEPSASRQDIVLFKIHGSTNWTRAGKEIMKSATPVYIQDDSAHENVLIYPANRKVAIEDPFFTGYDYFQRCMENCLLCIVIGYSFRDYDALTKLMSAARYNPRLKLAVLDPNAKQICESLRKQQIQAEPLAFNFGANDMPAYVPQIKSALANSAAGLSHHHSQC